MAGTSHLYPYKGTERKMMEGMKKALKPESHKG
jgi:anthraniloyl-CoA monooxygenase